MTASSYGSPTLLPVLSRGRHRNARKGACFMEMASYLAGERWSDRPRCTHPLLAQVARSVNDHTSDAHRSELAPLIPSVIGVNSDDARLDANIVRRCAQAALPVVSAERQNTMAVSLLTAEAVLNRLSGSPPGQLSQSSRWALEQTPLAAKRARQLVDEIGVSVSGFRRHAAQYCVQVAVRGIAEACVPDPDQRLRDLLAAVIEDCAPVTGQPADVREQDWVDACRLTGAR
ncbi:MAG: hypothetical protein M3419_02135 [Actinomycetota bacterium]|nr:hypothetical protein [Actinomycetota bacterium]